ncbi:alpha-amylase family glycosyl hydrolase [Paenibacillus wynnii]|uniref:alpha-amylase family glycosyl hydrolase n=1 Tax=Paenibacillus wynnii TaxID=268407 RepID=UPI00068C25DB|nr:alpha-amylase family glycosyl hydrolase [Paenibacillus wynnii]
MKPNLSTIHKYRPLQSLTAVALTLSILIGCSSDSEGTTTSLSPLPSQSASPAPSPAETSKSPSEPSSSVIDEQPSTVFYEIFVRSFYDSNGDGIGDLRGITEKLDYLNDGNSDTKNDLGVGGIWLMPINPSPSYHGYDVTDYRAVNPDYGTLEDLQVLVEEAHKRGIKVIMDLVVNHTSKSHPWFIDSAKNKDGDFRDWYVWAEDQNRPVKGTSASGSGDPWHSVLGSHYLGIFWDGMPDLNFDNPEVRSEMKDIGRFWLEKGIDGFRLDAAKHIYEDLSSDKSEATTSKNVAWWQDFRKAMSEVNPEAYIVGEVWENSAVSVGAYLNQAFDSGFNFGLAESLLQSAKSEKDSGIAYTLERTYKLYSKISDGAFTDAIFLTNHDQNRVMSQLDDDPNHAKMAAALLLTLPGNPFIYYGEEIGMLGVKPDEGIREPMGWYAEGTGKGQTTWENRSNNEGSDSSSVDIQNSKGASLLQNYRDLIAVRNEVPALQNGNIRDYASGNSSITAFERLTTKERVLVVHNLSGQEQHMKLTAKGNDGNYTAILKDLSKSAALNGEEITLPPYSTVILQP